MRQAQRLRATTAPAVLGVLLLLLAAGQWRHSYRANRPSAHPRRLWEKMINRLRATNDPSSRNLGTPHQERRRSRGGACCCRTLLHRVAERNATVTAGQQFFTWHSAEPTCTKSFFSPNSHTARHEYRSLSTSMIKILAIGACCALPILPPPRGIAAACVRSAPSRRACKRYGNEGRRAGGGGGGQQLQQQQQQQEQHQEKLGEATTTTCFPARKCRGASCRDYALAVLRRRGEGEAKRASARAEPKPRSSPGRRRQGKGAPVAAAGRQCILKGKKRQRQLEVIIAIALTTSACPSCC